ncbi:nitroreductase [Streptomyces sp. Root369]|uniref:nitroreductase n=1 Tax=Streptomyces sp. Root369 TaxID=1736523 RepID=UPI000710E815|nr:nitroreductase [Streptomyces sp. Root369]KQW10660.1 nitroreductase [Streptomyces sp. Root369]
MPGTASPFTDIARARRSPRRFLPTALSSSDIRGVLEDAQTAPSNSNTQPWTVHVVSGAARDALAEYLLRAEEEGRTSPDFTDGYGDGIYLERAQALGASHYRARGIGRSDRDGRSAAVRENLEFYGAPHAAFLFMPALGDGVRTAGDIGMYAQNFLLSLSSRGLAGIPQTVLGVYADTVREFLGVPAELKLLFGISFGMADPAAPVNTLRTERVPLQRSVVLHDTPGVLDGS